MSHTATDWGSKAFAVVAIGTGLAVLGANTQAVIKSGHIDPEQANVMWALAGALAVGAIAVGRAFTQGRRSLAIGIGIALALVEIGGVVMSSERVIETRDRSQVEARQANERHEAASKQLDAAILAKEKADSASILKSAEKGCKENCRVLLAAQVTNANAELEAARKVYNANPKVSVSGSPLADRLGIAPWIIDLALAGLLGLGINGLAATLIAFAAHGGNGKATVGNGCPATVPENKGSDEEASNRPQPPNNGGRPARLPGNPVATKAAAEADVIRLVSRGERIPEQDVLAARWNVHKGTASKWCRDFEARGIIKRKREGRRNVVAMAG